MRGWKNTPHANGKQNKAGVAILISDKIDLKIKITRDKEEHCIMIKGSIQKEDITSVNIYAPNAGSILGLGRSPGEGNGSPLQYSCLENPTDKEAW